MMMVALPTLRRTKEQKKASSEPTPIVTHFIDWEDLEIKLPQQDTIDENGDLTPGGDEPEGYHFQVPVLVNAPPPPSSPSGASANEIACYRSRLEWDDQVLEQKDKTDKVKKFLLS